MLSKIICIAVAFVVGFGSAFFLRECEINDNNRRVSELIERNKIAQRDLIIAQRDIVAALDEAGRASKTLDNLRNEIVELRKDRDELERTNFEIRNANIELAKIKSDIESISRCGAESIDNALRNVETIERIIGSIETGYDKGKD